MITLNSALCHSEGVHRLQVIYIILLILATLQLYLLQYTRVPLTHYPCTLTDRQTDRHTNTPQQSDTLSCGQG